MRILLLGEYSGLFNCLKDGLKQLGHDVVIASDGDGYKNYPSDYSWRVNYEGRLGAYVSLLKALKLLDKFRGFDIVHVISPLVMTYKANFGPFLFSYLKKYNGAVFLSGAGMTAQVYQYWLSQPDSKYYKYVLGYIDEVNGRSDKIPFTSSRRLKSEFEILSLVDGYIPIMHEYSVPFHGHPKLLKTIPIPINISKYLYTPNNVGEKILFFHGITKKCKGGEFIIQAFEELRDKYKNEAELIVAGGMPFSEYIQYLQTVNVILDDTNAYSLGMNSLFSMAQGRIVMGGAEPHANKELGYINCPAINLYSDVDYIKNEIEKIILNRSTLLKLGEESRKFVEEHHDYIEISKKYLKAWGYND